ncbi:MAG: FkbM family methyltransferase [Chloroflexi bacterium]|nr:FkbM family methyltransferase [Chloroflexota bacterium]
MSQLSLHAQLEGLLNEDIASVINREQSAFDDLTAPFSESLVLFGTGNLGRKTLAGLRNVGIEPLAFADNNPALWGTEVEGVQVLSPKEAAQRFGRSAVFVVTIWRAIGGDRMAQRCQQLLNLQCSRVVPFGYLFWKYPQVFLPHYAFTLPHTVCEQADDIRRVFALWEDEASRSEYLAQIRWRILLDFDGLPSPIIHEIYFPDDLVMLLPDEVFVDCGAFDGDTARSFLCRQGTAFGRYIAFEPDPANFQQLKHYVSTLPRLVQDKMTLYPYAVGACRERVQFEASGTVASTIGHGASEVECVTLDEMLDDLRPTHIKADIEGYELEALRGARRLIERDTPVIAISVYHRQDHLWRIPLLIDSMSNQYRYFLRPHDLEAWDLVLYAVPVSRLIAKPTKR